MARLASSKSSEDKSLKAAEGYSHGLARRTTFSGPQAHLLELQRIIGNRTLSQFLQSCTGGSASDVNGALPISKPGDEYEKEAARVADQVLRVPEETGAEAVSFRARDSIDGVASPTANSADRLNPSAANGQSLPGSVRAFFEPRFGLDFSRVRVHTDLQAEESAGALNARAFTAGSDIVFGKGQYAPQTPGGLSLLAHELTHVAQQGALTSHSVGGARLITPGAAPQIQGSFFEDVWESIKSAGQAVGGAVTSAAEWLGARAGDVGRFLTGTAEYVGERLRDISLWAINLIRDLPGRLTRLATTIVEGLAGVVTFIPEAIQALASGGLSGFASWLWKKAKRGGAWVLTLLSRVFDVLGGPELFEFIWHIVTKARPLKGEEIAAASSVLGSNAIRWGEVRVAEGGLLSLIFSLNEARAFVSFHTVNLPPGKTLDTVVHEATHVYQYDRAGSVYLGQALHAQATRGAGAYNYGGPTGLVTAKTSGKHYGEFNREEQAQIAQDYYKYVVLGQGTLTTDQRQAYDFYIGELRAGDL